MKKLLTALSIVVLCNNFLSQTNYFWAKPLSGSGASSLPGGITTDAAGNVYSIGSFTGTIDFDPGPGTFTMSSVVNNASAYIVKLDVVGNLVWAKQFISSCACWGNAITLDPSGNVLTTGYYCGTTDFNPGPTTNSLSAQNYNCFISKLDANGNYVWAKQFNGGGNEYGNGIACDASGNVYTTGQYLGTCDFDPSPSTYTLPIPGSTETFISKLSSTGTFVAAYSLAGANNDGGNYIYVDASNNIYTAGLFSGTSDFDPGIGTYNLTSLGLNDIFINKLDINGNFLWAGQIGGVNDDFISGLGVDGSGNVITSGYFSGVADLDPSLAVNNFTSNGSEDIFYSKLNSSGAFVWSKQIGGTSGDESHGIYVDATGNVFGTGYFAGSVDFDPGPGIVTLTTAGLPDIYLLKLNSAGTYSFALKLGSAAGLEIGYAITVDAAESIISTGYFQNTVDFDPNIGVANLTSVAVYDTYIHKLAQCAITPAQPASITGPTTLCANVTSTYTSATVAGATAYMWMLPPGWTGITANSTIVVTPGTSGIFSVAATNSCGAGPVQTLSITVNALPSMTITPYIGSICVNGSLTLNAAGANSYTWLPGPVSPSISVTPTVTTSYTISGTGPLGCTNTAVRIVTVYPNPTITAVSGTSVICAGEPVTFTASGANNYNWNPGGSGSTITLTPTITTTYTIIGSTADGCSGTTTLTQIVDACLGLNHLSARQNIFKYFPNPFTNVFTISVTDYHESIFELYDVTGKLTLKLHLIESKTEVDLKNEPSGIYFGRVSQKGIQHTIKLIKE